TAGNGYLNPPAVTLSGGGGSGGTIGTPDMVLTGTTINDVGTGYTSVPTVTITGGSPAVSAAVTATPTLSLDQSQLLLTPGSGFTSAPTVAITGGGGTVGTITAD